MRLPGLPGLMVALGLLAGAPALGQAPAAAPAAPAAETLDPDAMAALARMGAFLRGLPRFEVRSDAATETVFASGQKLQGLVTTRYLVRAPDRLRVDVDTGKSHRAFYYDGSSVTVAALKAGMWTRFPATGTVAELVGRAADDFGIELPLADLFTLGTEDAPKPVSGFRVGDSAVDGRPAGHYAFRQPGVDFQIWIAEGAAPLPLRLVIVNTTNPAQPAFTARLTWDLAPDVADAQFRFTPRPGDELVDFGTAALAGPAAAQR